MAYKKIMDNLLVEFRAVQNIQKQNAQLIKQLSSEEKARLNLVQKLIKAYLAGEPEELVLEILGGNALALTVSGDKEKTAKPKKTNPAKVSEYVASLKDRKKPEIRRLVDNLKKERSSLEKAAKAYSKNKEGQEDPNKTAISGLMLNKVYRYLEVSGDQGSFKDTRINGVGKGWYCGVVAPLNAFVRRNPDAYVAMVLDLIKTG